MNSKTCTVFIILLVLIAWTALSGQSNEKVLPDTSSVRSNAVTIINYLYDNDWLATDWIAWEDFSLNGESLGYDYLDAYDYYEEDYFMEDTIKRISDMLVYEGSDKDSYIRYTGEFKNDSVIVKTSNKKKSITMLLKPANGKSQTLYELTITDKK